MFYDTKDSPEKTNGMSFLAKLEMSKFLMDHDKVIIIDPGEEYPSISDYYKNDKKW